ncbi:MAG: M20/M25/M40 family metallo-hydrolase [Capsulimonadales bacterium]|nr:M20/M25/M40 family metallo-hydrolase [Capsulimonadales bacterium]
MKPASLFAVGLLGVVFLPAAPARAQRDFAEGKALAESYIREDSLRENLTYIASDELRGRDTPSPGLDMAAKFIAERVKSWGLKPMGGDGTYFQKIVLQGARMVPERSGGSLGNEPLKYGDDFLARTPGGGTGSLVYVSHGYVIPSRGIDPYKGIDVRGKFLVVTGNSPADVPFQDLRRMERGKDYQDVRLVAEKSGAAGILSLPSSETPDAWAGFRSGWERFGGQLTPVGSQNTRTPSGGPLSVIPSPMLVEKLFAGEKVEGAVLMRSKPTESFELSAGKTLTLNVVRQQEEATTQNVVALVDGSDPALRNEYVVIGAHYDHIGVGRPDGRGDAIYNGADDDGSGTVAMLAMAEAFGRSKVKPRRSILFVWHCGEEKGLWGSDYFTSRPTVPLTSIITQLNIDMIGRSRPEGDAEPRNADLSGPNEVYMIGSKRMSTELGELAEQVNARYLNLTYNYRYDDPADPNRFFFRSDHYNYARRGVPIIFWFDGTHVDYHRPSDEVARIDFAKLMKITRTIFMTGVELANRDKRPVVDKKLDQ